jgi:hypothetical protein
MRLFLVDSRTAPRHGDASKWSMIVYLHGSMAMPDAISIRPRAITKHVRRIHQLFI